MLVMLRDIQDYWKRYCERHALKGDIVSEGERQILLNPDYWADHTMPELTDVAIKHLDARSGKGRPDARAHPKGVDAA